MTDVLCKWLNLEVKLSKLVVSNNIAELFSNGKMIAEILWKYGIIENFDDFVDDYDEKTVQDNFNLLKSYLEKLHMHYSDADFEKIQRKDKINIIDFIYRLFVCLESQKYQIRSSPEEKKENYLTTNLSEMSSSEMQRAMSATLESCNRLQQMINMKKEEIKLKLERREEKYQKFMEEKAKRALYFMEMHKLHERSQIDSSSLCSSKKTKAMMEQQKKLKKKEIVEQVYKDLDAFKSKMGMFPPLRQPASPDICTTEKGYSKSFAKSFPKKGHLPPLDSNIQLNAVAIQKQEYIDRVRKQLTKENEMRLMIRQRRSKIINKQLQLFQEEENKRTEDLMIDILLRRSNFERKLISEFMRIQHEKDILCFNRILRTHQLATMKEKEYLDYLETEKRHAQLVDYLKTEQVKKEWNYYKAVVSQESEDQINQKYAMCNEIALHIADFAICIAEYKIMSHNNIPPMVLMQWRRLFCEGRPFFGELGEKDVFELPVICDIEAIHRESLRQDILDSYEFKDYLNNENNWNVPEESKDEHNLNLEKSILAHVIHTILHFVYPLPPLPTAPELPYNPIRGAVLGKFFSGKTSLLQKVAADFPSIKIISFHQAVVGALEMAAQFKNIFNLPDVESKVISKDALNEFDSSDDIVTRIKKATNQMSSSVTDKLQTGFKKSSNGNLAKNVLDSHETDNTPEEQWEHEEEEEDVPIILPTLAVLGKIAAETLDAGKTIDNSVLVQILLEAVRHLPEGTSWFLDGFPQTLEQAKLIEQIFNAYYTPEELYTLHSMNTDVPNIYELRKSQIVENPDPPPPPPLPKSIFDLVVHLDADDEDILKWLAVSTLNDDLETNINLASNQYRLRTFNKNIDDLLLWYNCFGVLRTLKATRDEDVYDVTYLQLHEWISDLLNLKLNMKTQELTVISEEVQAWKDNSIKELGIQCPSPTPSQLLRPVFLQSATADLEDLKQGKKMPKKETGSRIAAGMDSTKSLNLNKSSELTSSASFRLSETYSRITVDSTGNDDDDDNTSTNIDDNSDELTPIIPIYPAQPGDSNWSFIHHALPKEVAQSLAKLWQALEINYTLSFKYIARKLRYYMGIIIENYHEVEEEFKSFLQRPDHKQEFVSRWQSSYNAIHDDMRSDDETKAELHQRVADLRHTLYDISDQRLEQAKQELVEIVESGLAEDWLGITCNRYINLMQMELDRFTDTIHILKDYYDINLGFQLKEYPVFPSIVLPLIDLADTSLNPVAAKGLLVNVKRRISEYFVPSNNESIPEAPINCIPLMLRCAPRPKSDPSLQKKGKISPNLQEESDLIEIESFQSLLEKAYQCATDGVNQIINAILEENEEDANEVEVAVKDKKPEKKNNDKKKVKNFSDDNLYIPPECLEFHIKKSSDPKEKVKLEFITAITEEKERVLLKLHQIQLQANHNLEYIERKFQSGFQRMDYLLGFRYTKEIESIDNLCIVIGYAIEEERKIQEELLLEEDRFWINEAVILYESMPKQDSTAPEEPYSADHFTISQIRNLAHQFAILAPSGWIPTYLFSNTIHEILSNAINQQIMPDDWYKLTPNQAQDLVDYISQHKEHMDWKRFLLFAAKPWPKPTEYELLKVLSQCRGQDIDCIGLLTAEQFQAIQLWFNYEEDDPFQRNPYLSIQNFRLANFKNVLMDIFGTMFLDPPYLDYTDMLLHFAADEDMWLGFGRALSIACNYPVDIYSNIPSPKLSSESPLQRREIPFFSPNDESPKSPSNDVSESSPKDSLPDILSSLLTSQSKNSTLWQTKKVESEQKLWEIKRSSELHHTARHIIKEKTLDELDPSFLDSFAHNWLASNWASAYEGLMKYLDTTQDDCLIPFQAVLHVLLSAQPSPDAIRYDMMEVYALKDTLEQVFEQLGSKEQTPVLYSELKKHPYIQKLVADIVMYLELDIFGFIQNCIQQNELNLENSLQ